VRSECNAAINHQNHCGHRFCLHNRPASNDPSWQLLSVSPFLEISMSDVPTTFDKNVRAAKGSFTHVPDGPTPAQVSPIRADIEQATAPHTNEFSRAVRMVNSNLASHGNDELPREHADMYIRDTQRVENGEISRTTAFVNSAIQHAREGNAVGFVANAGGALVAGQIDARDQKLGRNMGDGGLSNAPRSKTDGGCKVM
jgi:hypothetical protein